MAFSDIETIKCQILLNEVLNTLHNIQRTFCCEYESEYYAVEELETKIRQFLTEVRDNQ